LIRAELARLEQDYAQALGLYEQVLERDRSLISEVFSALYACFEATGRLTDFERYVEKLIATDKQAASDVAYAAIVAGLTGSPVLVKCIENFVVRDEILGNLVNREDLQSSDAERRAAAFARITNALRRLALSSARYRCTNCGYSTQRFIWHCPSCKLWESIRPIQRLPVDSLMA
jgi:lipopolysaccharide biosynthesis regulator YciM